jgi:opacity protein-like surface antigen
MQPHVSRSRLSTAHASPIAAALALALLAPFAVAAQDTPWQGAYIGGALGGSEPANDGGRILFDTNLDGGFGDTVRTAAGADAFSPGFCGGAANGRTPAEGCRDDKGGEDRALRAGYDWQRGNLVYGAVLEYTDHDLRDSVAAFSTTPAFYTMTRDLQHSVALRGRIGWSFGAQQDWLGYAAAGAVRAKVRNSFASSNAANRFVLSGDDTANGAQAGIGLERRVLERWSIGVEYLYTRVKDDGFRVRSTRGSAPATNPFILVNPNGTDFRRSDEDLKYGSVRVLVTWRF